MQEVGYQHGRTVFDIWGRSGVLEKMLQDRQGTSKTKASDVSARAGGRAPAEAHPLVPVLPLRHLAPLLGQSGGQVPPVPGRGLF